MDFPESFMRSTRNRYHGIDAENENRTIEGLPLRLRSESQATNVRADVQMTDDSSPLDDEMQEERTRLDAKFDELRNSIQQPSTVDQLRDFRNRTRHFEKRQRDSKANRKKWDRFAHYGIWRPNFKNGPKDHEGFFVARGGPGDTEQDDAMEALEDYEYHPSAFTDGESDAEQDPIRLHRREVRTKGGNIRTRFKVKRETEFSAEERATIATDYLGPNPTKSDAKTEDERFQDMEKDEAACKEVQDTVSEFRDVMVGVENRPEMASRTAQEKMKLLCRMMTEDLSDDHQAVGDSHVPVNEVTAFSTAARRDQLEMNNAFVGERNRPSLKRKFNEDNN